MNLIAIKMLMGDRAKYIGIVTGLTFTSLLITQQSAIFVGVMLWTYGLITDIGQPDIWVMDPCVQYVDDPKPVNTSELYRVRGIPGVEWAVPMFRNMIRTRLRSGKIQECLVLGLDDATLIGGPARITQGKLEDLRRNDAVFVNVNGATKRMTSPGPDGKMQPLKIGDSLEINDHRVTVAGFCETSHTFQWQPVIYTTFSRAMSFAPFERKLMNFVLVKVVPGVDPDLLCKRITDHTGLAAYTREGFKQKSMMYYLKYTGLPLNFGIAVLLGFIVGAAIAGQTFHNFTQDNLRHFGALKAMGATTGVLLRMILLQAFMVGAIGYGLGVGAASIIGALAKGTELSFHMPWQLLLVSAGTVLIICMFAASISMIKVIRLEPAIVFKS